MNRISGLLCRLADNRGEFFGSIQNFGGILAFDHDSQQGLGAGGRSSTLPRPAKSASALASAAVIAG